MEESPICLATWLSDQLGSGTLEIVNSESFGFPAGILHLNSPHV